MPAKIRKKAGRFISSAFIGLNEWTENNARFAAYVTSREMGRSIQRSVSDAKEVTVNFNRKGGGGYGAAEVRAMYAFVNVGIQGLQQHIHNWKIHPVRMSIAVVERAAVSAFLIPLFNNFITTLFGGDDDENKWEDDFVRLPDYVRNNTYSLWTGKGFIHIPLPQEYRAYNAIGTNFYLYANGKIEAKKMAEDFVVSMLELVAYNPALDVAQGSIADAFPTAIVPAAQVHENKTFTASPIYNEWADEDKPQWAQVRRNKKGEAYAPQALIDFFRVLSDATGGDNVQPGAVNLNPDVVNHLLNGYVGAIYKPVIQSLDVIRGDTELNKMLVAKSMFTASKDLPLIDPYTNEQYFDAAKEVEKAYKYYQGYAKDSELELEAFLKMMAEEHPDVLSIAQLNDYPKIIKEREKGLKGADEQTQKAIEAEVFRLKVELLDKIREAKRALGEKE
jgi:hypothetical protein